VPAVVATGLTYTYACVTITGTAGQFQTSSTTLVVGQTVTISGTNTGSGTISGYVSGAIYYIITTNGSTTFTLSTTATGLGVTTTTGIPTGLAYTFNPVLSSVTITGNAGQFSCSLTRLSVGQTVSISGTLGGTGGIFRSSLSNVAITGTAGQFSCSSTAEALVVGQRLTISGTLGGTGTISGYVNPTTYYITTTNGSTTFTLSTTSGGSGVTTTAGTPTGLTYNVLFSTPASFYIIATDGSTTFTLSKTLTGSGITTTVGTPTGLTYTVGCSSVVFTAGNGVLAGNYLDALLPAAFAAGGPEKKSQAGGNGYISATVLNDVCGDNTATFQRTSGEECDQGNTNNGDGCSSTCTVESGYTCTGGTWSTFDTCVDTDGCSGNLCNSAGDSGSTCTDVAAPGTGYTCICTSNYYSLGTENPKCEPNGCIGHTCASGGNSAATCVDNLYPSTGYTCSCTTGYSGTTTCTDINECSDVTCAAGTCSDVAAPGTGYTCACNPGYSMVNNVCVDTDGCASGSTCNNNAYGVLGGTCRDIAAPGTGYTCTCSTGFALVGLVCVETNECASSSTCNSASTCFNTIGSYICSPSLANVSSSVLTRMTGGDTVTVTLSVWTSRVIIGAVSYGRTVGEFPCAAVSPSNLVNGVVISCTTSSGYGSGHQMWLTW